MDISTIKEPTPVPQDDRVHDYEESMTPVILSAKVIPISIVNTAKVGRRSELDNKTSSTELILERNRQSYHQKRPSRVNVNKLQVASPNKSPRMS